MPKSSVHSKVANEETRNQYGKFTSATPASTPPSPNSPNPPNPPNTPNPSNPSDDLVNFKIKNPLVYPVNWLKSFFKKQSIRASINIPPLTAIAIALAIAGGGIGLGYNLGFNAAISKFFPNSSPLLHRIISVSGNLQKGANGQYFLNAEDNSLWNLKSKADPDNLTNLINTKVSVKGNLTSTPNLIENAEIIPLESSTSPTSKPSLLKGPNSIETNQDADLPKLYSNIKWETTQKKTLLFTSGKRRIEQEGVYLESSQMNTLPQDFFDYYKQQLTDSGFKQTLNSSDPDGIMFTYAKDNLFFSFGAKFIYSGSGDKKQLTRYKAYIEHN